MRVAIKATDERPGLRRPHLNLVVTAAAVVAIVLRLLLIRAPAGADEAGFWMVAHQWRPGDSLYGDYWVDRPPLLIVLFWMAPDLAGLRLLGIVASIGVVIAVAMALWRMTGSRFATGVGAFTAALLTSMPWLGTARVNGEILAAPFVGVAIVATVVVCRRLASGSGRADAHPLGAVAFCAGAAAVAAACVKQSSVDGVVFVGVALLATAIVNAEVRRRALGLLLVAAGGAVCFVAALLALAASRGTDPMALFDALLIFRAEAGEVVRAAASAATAQRAAGLVVGWTISGLALITLASVPLIWRRVAIRWCSPRSPPS